LGGIYLIIPSLIRNLQPRLRALLNIIRRNHPRPVFMQTQPIIVRRDLLRVVLVLLVAQLRLAPRVLLARQADAQVRVRDEPVVDLGAVDGVLAVGQARGALGFRVCAEVGAAGSLERFDGEGPVGGEDAIGAGLEGREGDGEAGEAEGGCEDGLHGEMLE
jgi:hypothetical protein